jgi:CubicO group peptidase (beta-lactamase class C family)
LDGSRLIRSATFTVTLNGETEPLFNYEYGGTTLDTPQNIWSSSKILSAAAIMREVEKGTVELDVPIHTYLPYWTRDETDARSRITLRHLLGFSSGYVNLGQIQGCVRPSTCVGGNIQECVEAVYNEIDHVHEPGKEIHYNSLHLQIAGAVLERATGTPIMQTIRDNVFSVVGMESAEYSQWGTEENPCLAGGIKTTPRDYTAFLDAYTAGEIVSQETVDIMGTDQHPQAEPQGIFRFTAAKYGIGQWAECPQFVNLRQGEFTAECASAKISGSAGLSGTFPIVDRNFGYHSYLGYDGIPLIGAAVSAIFRDTLKPLVDAAVLNDGSVFDLPTEMPEERVLCLFDLMDEVAAANITSDYELSALIDSRSC